jgi:signal transduction histidine kinase
MSRADLVERLSHHRTLGRAPREELAWLASHGETRQHAVGDSIAWAAKPSDEMIIVLAGHIVQYVDRGSGPRKFMEWRDGEVTGSLPYSRMISPPGDSIVERDAEILAIRRESFPALIGACPTVTAMLVHAMLDRARDFTSSHFQDEKTMSLGRLAAGLAHELNNPASAAARSALRLREALAQATRASNALGAARLSESQRERIESMRYASRSEGAPRSAIERADLEDAMVEWLASRELDAAPASVLADHGFHVEELDDLASVLPRQALEDGVQLLAAEYSVDALATDIDRATTRIHDLVSAMKRFTNMDRAVAATPVDVTQGLSDSVAVMSGRARERQLTIRLELESGLPFVLGHAVELTQVWANLLDNALDAANASSEIVVSAAHERDDVVVRVIDDGAGIPTQLQARVFEPFFTTKPVGQGTGLGLDIARRIVRLHRGQIDLDSRPGRTEFRVSLPASPS